MHSYVAWSDHDTSGLLTLYPSSHTCRGSVHNRVCTLRGLLSYGTRFIYVTPNDSLVDLPSISAYRPGSWKPKVIKIEQLSLAALDGPFGVPSDAPHVELPWAALIYRTHASNFGHHMLDVTPTLHK